MKDELRKKPRLLKEDDGKVIQTHQIQNIIDMHHAHFCKACLEGLWLSLLKRLDLVYGIHETGDRSASVSEGEGKWMKTHNVQLVPFAGLRQVPVTP